jgi:hypothetical protein
MPARGSDATVGKVTGKLPSPKKAATEITAFELGRAVQIAAAVAGRSGTFRLALPASRADNRSLTIGYPRRSGYPIRPQKFANTGNPPSAASTQRSCFRAGISAG